MITRILVIASAVIWLIWDVMAMPNGNPTESMVIRDWAHSMTWLPLVCGILMGHWFLNNVGINHDLKFVLPLLLVCILGDVAYHFFGPAIHPLWRNPILYVALGVPVGAFLWGQNV